jgi:hypothetical protein
MSGAKQRISTRMVSVVARLSPAQAAGLYLSRFGRSTRSPTERQVANIFPQFALRLAVYQPHITVAQQLINDDSPLNQHQDIAIVETTLNDR